MKRFLCLVISLALFLCGCQGFAERIKEPATFYYVHADYQKNLSAAIGSEEREASGHLDDLSYLLALYLMGPVSDELVSPIPPGTRIYVEDQTDDNVKLILSDTENTLTDSEFSVVCACLSLTCMGLAGVDEVTIVSGSRSVTMTPQNLSLLDADINPATEET